jgi:Holliday junction DNA helicase RuvA
MISRISGRLQQLGRDYALVEVNGVGYEVILPPVVSAALSLKEEGAEVELVTYHYLQLDRYTGIPTLCGFLSERDRQFFQRLITQTSLGARAALRTLAKPIPEIAQAIELGDTDFLQTLPGIGAGKAREIIAKLQGKLADFLVEETVPGAGLEEPQTAMVADALAILTTLQYRRIEALTMIRRALARNKEISTSEELVREALR